MEAKFGQLTKRQAVDKMPGYQFPGVTFENFLFSATNKMELSLRL
jgi:hypothetical protein